MNPFNLPCHTEYAYAHTFQPHPYLFTNSATMQNSVIPQRQRNGVFTLQELSHEQMPDPLTMKTDFTTSELQSRRDKADVPKPQPAYRPPTNRGRSRRQ
jgi:hypothetical protein